MFGLEAARLYATVGVQGMDALRTNLLQSGQMVDAFGGKKADAIVGVSGADKIVSQVEHAEAKIEELARTKAEPVIRVAGVDAAISKVDQLRAKIQSVAQSGGLGSFAQDISLGSGFRVAGRNAVGAIGQGMSTGGLGGGLAAGAGVLGPIGIAGGVIAGIGAAALGSAGEIERFETQLSVLFGSVGAAKDRIADLTQFAATTPFELPEVVNASKTLQVFTGDALSSGNALRLIGDVAAGTGSNFGETAMWFGRMYDALKSGRPFGEATMRLQEMGALSGQSREKIEALAEGVKSGAMTMDEAWSQVSGEFGRFSGMMEKQSTTLEGKMSNLSDAFGQTLGKLGTILLPVAKLIIDGFILMITTIGNVIGVIGHLIGVVADVAGAFVSWIASMGPVKFVLDAIGTAIGFVGDVLGTLGDIAGDVAEGVGDAMDDISGRTAAMAAHNQSMSEQWAVDFRKGEREATNAIDDLTTGAVDSFADMRFDTKRITADMLDDIIGIMRNSRSEWQDAWDSLKDDAENSMSNTVEIARLKAKLAKIAASEGWASGDPEWIASLVQTRNILEGRLDELTVVSKNKAEKMIDKMAEIIKDDKTVDAAAAERAEKLAQKFEALPGDAYDWGAALLREYIDGIHSKQAALATEVWLASTKVSNLLQLMSPAKEGPLSKGGGPEGWGARGAELYALGWSSVGRRLGRIMDGLRSSGNNIAFDPVVTPSSEYRMGSGHQGQSFVPIPVPMDWTPAERAAWAQRAGPAMADWLNRRRLLRR